MFVRFFVSARSTKRTLARLMALLKRKKSSVKQLLEGSTKRLWRFSRSFHVLPRSVFITPPPSIHTNTHTRYLTREMSRRLRRMNFRVDLSKPEPSPFSSATESPIGGGGGGREGGYLIAVWLSYPPYPKTHHTHTTVVEGKYIFPFQEGKR